MIGICIVDGCGKKAIKKDMCDVHYTRMKRHGDPNYQKIIVGDDTKRFHSGYKISSSGCWEWAKSVHRLGYGHFFFRGKVMAAHRASYLINSGPIPDGLYVLHRCNNKRCVNPEHLYLGTHQDNMDYMVKCKRSNKVFGERHGKSKITTEVAKKIIESCLHPKKIAEELGVSIHIVKDIKRCKTWLHAR